MRKSNWQSEIDKVIQKARLAKFKWGEHDCCIFPCDCIEAMMGFDPGEWFRGRYSTKKGAYIALNDYAGGGLMETAEKICTRHGWQEVAISYAQRGDVAVCTQEDGDTLGIMDLSGKYIMVAGDVGIIMQPLSSTIKVWRVE